MYSFRVCSILLLLLVSLTCVYAQNSNEAEQSIRNAVEQKNWSAVVSETSRIRTADASLFREKNYDYLLGRAAEKSGDLAAATTAYQSVISRNARLSQYSLWHLARMARGTGDLPQEREHLRRLIASGPNSLLYESAVLRLTESFFESGDFAGAANNARLTANTKNVPIARENQLLLGQSLLRLEKTSEARDVFVKLLMQMPDASRADDFALQATRELDQIDKNSQANLSEADRLLRASVYQFNRDFAGARVHYEAVIRQNPQSPTVPNAMYQLGRGFYLEGNYTEAIATFQKVADQFPQNQSAREALGYLGSSYVRLKRTDDAVNAYKTLIDRFTDGPNLERPYLNIIDALHEAARYSEALNWIQQTRARFKGDIGATLAVVAKLRIDFAQNAWPNVMTDISDLLQVSDLGGTRVPGGTSKVELDFLRAYLLEQLANNDAAITAYLEIPDGRNEYYGSRATLRIQKIVSSENLRARFDSWRNQTLKAIKNATDAGEFDRARTLANSALRLSIDPSQRKEVLDTIRSIYAQLPQYQLQNFQIVSLVKETAGATETNPHRGLANDLLVLALYDEAIPEYLAARTTTTVISVQPQTGSALPKSAPAFSNEDYTVAVYSLQGGLPNRAVRFAEQFWRTVPADYVVELAPRTLIELLYPVPYRDSLLKHAPPRNVDPRYVLSIARQESRYQADAKSVAAARGMMQFIASTANEVAAQLKLSDFSQDNLYDPDTSILFGSQYLSTLFQQFPNQPEAVAASYNGGADNMARWMGRSRSTEPERYVIEIGFTQSKDYVYKVMSNFWTYQRLYDAQLQPIVGKN